VSQTILRKTIPVNSTFTLLILALLLAWTCSDLAGKDSAPETLESLVGRWDFDDGTGKDLSGNENDAILGGTRIYSL